MRPLVKKLLEVSQTHFYNNCSNNICYDEDYDTNLQVQVKVNTAQSIRCLNSMQFSIIVIDMDSGVYDAHCFEIKPIQILLHISLTIVYLK